MLSNEEVEQKFKEMNHVVHIAVEGDGYKYFLTVVSDVFLNKSKVARQQWVYAQLKDLITQGHLHALSMDTWTREEWENQHG